MSEELWSRFIQSLNKFIDLSHSEWKEPWNVGVREDRERQYLDLCARAAAVELPRPPFGWNDFNIWLVEVQGRLEFQEARLFEDKPKQEDANPPDNYADYREGPGGHWLTAAYCKEAFGVSGKDLYTDSEAKKNRRKNPAGRKGGDYVYRYTDVTRIANRKPETAPPGVKELAERRDQIRSERK